MEDKIVSELQYCILIFSVHNASGEKKFGKTVIAVIPFLIEKRPHCKIDRYEIRETGDDDWKPKNDVPPADR
ncbi:hypothetical protein FACS18942_10640 [Planctomycetales bacterium]|nr:hypothetical protein FACS18942_10640 [Planctomycetales bacterium]GHT35786.1 hypothetical protein FACS189427_05910 [Planctomycetales bacterium]